MRKIIFLDIDGCMNSLASWVAYHPDAYDEFHLDRVAVGLLKRLCEMTGAEIVVSSSWRHHFKVEGIARILADHGFPNPPVIDQTDDIAFEKRSLEINKWLWDARDRGEWDFATDRYVVIDDCWIDEKLHPGKHCKTDELYGFGLDKFIEALIILDPYNEYFEYLYTRQPLLTGFDPMAHERLRAIKGEET